MLSPEQRAHLTATLASSGACTHTENPRVVDAVEQVMDARVHGAVRLPMRGPSVEAMLAVIASVMCGTPTTPTESNGRYVWARTTPAGTRRTFIARSVPPNWLLAHEVTVLAPEDARTLTPEQARQLERIAPGIDLGSVQRALAAAEPVDLYLMPLREVDSVEWLIQRVAMTMFTPRLQNWYIASSARQSHSYHWTHAGVAYEVYVNHAQRRWYIRAHPAAPRRPRRTAGALRGGAAEDRGGAAEAPRRTAEAPRKTAEDRVCPRRLSR